MATKVCFLHIGKTGGTAARMPIRQHRKAHPDAEIELPGHKVGLIDLVDREPELKVIFYIREPVSRYISGFNSRLRKGWPRHEIKWRPEEEETFTLFKTPNALAEALSSSDRSLKKAAKKGIKAIRHTRLAYQHYLGSVELLEQQKDRILFIGQTETMDLDFEITKRLLGMDLSAELPKDDVAAHRAPEGYDKTISELGRANIEEWYKDDLAIYAWCKAYRDELVAKYKSEFGL